MPFKDRPFFRRMLDLDELLRRQRRVNCSTLAQRWETSTKTIQRFVRQMRDEFDAPVEYDPVRRSFRYSDPAYRLPWMPVEGAELFAIGVAMKVLQIYEGTPAARDMKAVFERLRELMPAEVRVRPTSVVERLHVLPQALRIVKPEVWDAVVNGLRERNAVEVHYRKPGRTAERRNLEPFWLVLADTSWLLLARDPGDGAVKIFHLSRMESARVLAAPFVVPKDFDPGAYFGDSIGTFVGRASFRFRVRFDATLAPTVAEVRWHPKQQMVHLPGGGLELDLPIESTWEARRFVLSFGRHARAISPPELVAEMGDEVAALAEVYGVGEDGPGRKRVRGSSRLV